MTKKIACLAAFLILGMTIVRADEQLREVQQALKDQGFYYGEVTGEPGPETTTAIKRYQIRNGLAVTSSLNPETLSSLKIGGGASEPGTPSGTPAPVSTPQNDAGNGNAPAPSSPDKDYLRTEPAPTAGAQMAPRPAGPGGGAAPLPDYAFLFRQTPYEIAPGVVQQDTVRRAQMRLGKGGYFDGEPDGAPGAALARAIARYQKVTGLPPTGRLDMNTLASMDLLPKRHVVIPRNGFIPPGPGRGNPGD